MLIRAYTNTQLYNQLRERGYSAGELARAHAAYALAVELHANQLRPDGRLSIGHFVGVASRLASLGRPPNTVLAGLVHATYSHGDFGTLLRGASAKKRRWVRRRLGDEVEDLVFLYQGLSWGARFHLIARELPGYDARRRECVLIALANELDDLDDAAVLYTAEAPERRRSAARRRTALLEMCRELQQPELARDLDAAIAQVLAVEVAPELRFRLARGMAQIPASLRPRLKELVRLAIGPLSKRVRDKLLRARYRMKPID